VAGTRLGSRRPDSVRVGSVDQGGAVGEAQLGQDRRQCVPDRLIGHPEGPGHGEISLTRRNQRVTACSGLQRPFDQGVIVVHGENEDIALSMLGA
jgi:hypothetical protein